MKISLVRFATVAALAALPISAQTDVEAKTEKAAPTVQPEAARVLERCIEASGGHQAMGKLKNRITEIEVEIEGQGMKFTLIAYYARPNKSYLHGEITGLGTVEEGSDGEHCWGETAMTGLVVHEGEELEDKLLSSAFDPISDWKKLFKGATYKGEVEIDDRTYHKLVMTPAAGTEQTWFFDVESGLLVRQEGVAKEMGSEFDTVTKLTDYREVDGVMIPHKLVTELGTIMTQSATITSIEHNVEMPDERFDLPEGAKKTLAKRKAKAEKKKKAEAKEAKSGGTPR